MSVEAINWAVQQDVRGPAKCVLIVLANRANGGDTCWPSLDRISYESGVSKRTVQNAIAALENLRLIEKNPNGRGNIYTLQMAHVLPQTQELPQTNDAPPAMTDAPPAMTDASGASTDAPPATKPKGNQKNRKEPKEAPPDFQELISGFSTPLQTACRAWHDYKQSAAPSKRLKPGSWPPFISQVRNKVENYGERAMIDAIETAMASGWAGCFHGFDKLPTNQTNDRKYDKSKGF